MEIGSEEKITKKIHIEIVWVAQKLGENFYGEKIKIFPLQV